MLTDLLKAIEKWQLPVIVGLGGLVFLYLSFFTGLPSPGNAWTPLLRASTQYGLLAIGGILIASAIGMVLVPMWRPPPNGESSVSEANLNPASEPKAASQLIQTAEPDDPNLHPMVLKYWKLPKTQKEIVVLFYEHSHKPHLPLDTFYKALVARHGSAFLKSADELFYRLKALRVDGFLEMAAVAQKETDVLKLDDVRKALSAADIIST